MSQALTSGSTAFRPRARLLKLIGAELISDDVLAVTELVKNAHDADASFAKVDFAHAASTEASITIQDDGSGMDLETLLRHWMEPAATSKGPRARVTPRGRRVLGEKGVGRFAADKLGRQLELVSRPTGDGNEVRAVFDWDQYENDSLMLSQIRNRWQVRPAKVIPVHGTVLRIRGLRTTWNERMFRRLSARLSRLLSPFRQVDDFKILIQSDLFPLYSGELRQQFLKKAPYSIEASFDGNEAVEVNLNGSRSVEHLWNGTSDLRCGPVRIRLFAFDLETDAVARVGPRMEVRAWLREWSGVSVYRDGFRVWPYGEPHDDWLRLDQRRVNNPVVRLSNNQVVGFVEILRDANPDLVDQTNREGLIHNRAFEDLRRLLYFVLQILEAQRQSQRHPRVPGEREDDSRAGKRVPEVYDQLEGLACRLNPGAADEVRRIAKTIRLEAVRQESDRQRILQGYSEMAAVGQAAAQFSQTIEPLLTDMERACGKIHAALAAPRMRGILSATRRVERSLREIEKRVKLLGTIGGRTRNSRRRAIDVGATLRTFQEMVQPFLASAGVRMEVDVRSDEILRVEMRPDTLCLLMHILTTNSVDWFGSVKDPAIRISARTQGRFCKILFSDNGPGVPQPLGSNIFEPLFSGKEAGFGMGLTIARDILTAHGGRIGLLNDRRRRGAAFELVLARKRSRATLHQ